MLLFSRLHERFHHFCSAQLVFQIVSITYVAMEVCLTKSCVASRAKGQTVLGGCSRWLWLLRRPLYLVPLMSLSHVLKLVLSQLQVGKTVLAQLSPECAGGGLCRGNFQQGTFSRNNKKVLLTLVSCRIFPVSCRRPPRSERVNVSAEPFMSFTFR